VASATEDPPHVVLMDIRMPGISGITAAERILAKELTPRPRIIMLTTFDTDEYVYAALRAGSCGFLLKDAPPEKLLSAISTIARGDSLFAPTVIRRLVEAYAPHQGGPPRRPAALVQLTCRELDVLRLVAQGLANDEIAAALTVSEATVKTHVHRVMTKMDLRSRAQAVVVAYEAGLVVPRGQIVRCPRGHEDCCPRPKLPRA